MPSWENRFDDEMLTKAAHIIGIQKEALKHIGGFENVIYGFEREGRALILRVTHDSHRSVELMASEMHFMDYLAKHGVQIASPVAFDSGNLMECISRENETFILTLFVKAPGGHIDARHKDWGPQLFEQWGEITGTMHALEQNYELPEGMIPRPHQDKIDFDLSKFSEIEKMAYEKLLQVDAQINALPHEAGAYGLCHRDLHHGNFHVHNGQMIAFDFDDCGYDYFLQDIAMAVYYGSVFGNRSMLQYDKERISELANGILTSFMKGYNREYQLDSKWLVHLPLFIEKRRLELFLLLFEEFGNSADQDKKAWLEYNLHEIEQGIPCMELDIQ